MTSPSSSSRSIKSHSSSPRKPAPWQTSGTYSKKSAQSSLSLVFAQPESGASLPAAVDRLPVHRVLSATSMKPVENSGAQDAKAVDQTKTASDLAAEPHVDKLEEQPAERQSNVGKATSGSIAGYEPEATEPSNAPAHHNTSQAPGTAIATEPSPEREQGQPSDRSTSNTVSQEETSGGITADTHESPRPKKHRSDAVLSSKRSWFSSLSRARSAERPPEDPAPASPPVPANHNSVSEPALPIPSDSPNSASTSAHVIIADASRSPPPSAAIPVPPSQPTSSPATGSTSSSPTPRRSWFGSMSSAPPSSVSQVPALPSMPDGPTTPMSIDEEVPKLQHADDAAPHTAPPIIISDESTPRLSSLNPSTSRYALSIPLLGRPKIPLDKALASAKAADIRDPSPAPPERVAKSESVATGTTSREKLAESGELAEVDRVDNLPEGRESDKVVGTNLAPNAPASSSSSSTWWGLVGWGSSTDSLGSRVVAEDMHPKDIPDSVAATPDVPVPVEATPTGPVQTQTALHEPPPEPECDPDPPTKAMSAMSNDTQRSSTWYAPWTWYGSGIAPTDDAATKPGQTDMDMDGLTPAEAVKEAALARNDEPVTPTQSASAPDRSDIAPARPAAPRANSDSSSSSDRNPIQSTIATNLHGWSAFFSSRTLGAKRVTDTERNENGMEVMDVPDPEEDDGEAKLVATSAGAGKEKVATKMTTQKGKVTTQTTVEGQQAMTTTEAEKTSKQAAVAKQNGATATEREVKQTTTTTTIQTETKPSASGNKGGKEKLPSRSSSKGRSGRASPVDPKPAPPNLVLPAWHETFELPPRSLMPTAPPSVLQRTIKIVSGLSGFLSKDDAGRGRKIGKRKGHARSASTMSAPETELYMAKELPRAWKAMEDLPIDEDVLKGCKRVIVLGIHGWFPGAVMRSVIGEPTGTSSKFATMMCQALDAFQEKHGVKLEKVTACPLEGEGTIEKRVEKLYESLTSNEEWMKDLHAADAIFVACHSQGSIVSTHLLDRLIQDKHIRTSRLADVLGSASAAVTSAGGSVHAPRPPQRVCCLALCGIHLGPLRYLSSSSVLQPYFQYFESAAARQLFEFQNTESEVSKNYVAALTRVLDHGTKMLYIASLNDQVVPIYSGIFTAAHHPLILRALYIDGDAYNSSDFLTNLLVLLTRILNAGLSDSGLAMHLSEATAGTLNGIGHSTAYEEPEVYSLAVDYLFMTNQGLEEHPELMVEPFSASAEQNDYEIPWRLRDLIADGRVHELFGSAFADLRDAFPHWQPKSAILRDVKRKLQPIQRLSTFSPSSPPLSPRSSKL